MSDLISCIIIRKIGAVRLIGNLIFFQVFQDFLFFQAENRADDAAAYRLHGTKSLQAGSSAQIVDNSFCQIVFIVSQGCEMTSIFSAFTAIHFFKF